MLILAPTLISYTERSREQKDVSTMDEVVNALILSASYQEVYDELTAHRVFDNVSCYIDQPTEASYEIVPTKIDRDGNVVQYTFDDKARTADETKHYAAGNMRGVTITFERANHPSGAPVLIKDAVINKFVSDEVISIEECPHLLSQLTLLVGKSLEVSSRTYRNSEFTIFVRLGATNSHDVDDLDAVAAYGQFSGTYLSSNDANYEVATKLNKEESE
jgi:hypothetical protein